MFLPKLKRYHSPKLGGSVLQFGRIFNAVEAMKDLNSVNVSQVKLSSRLELTILIQFVMYSENLETQYGPYFLGA